MLRRRPERGRHPTIGFLHRLHLQVRHLTGLAALPGDTARDFAADTGPAVRGAWIDVWLPTEAQAEAWGTQTLTITIH